MYLIHQDIDDISQIVAFFYLVDIAIEMLNDCYDSRNQNYYTSPY